MRKEFVYSALTGLAVAGSIGLTSFAATSNPAIPQMVPSSQTPQVEAVNTKTTTPDKEVADVPNTGTSDEGKTETQDDTIALPTGSITEAMATKIALTANAGTTVTRFETEDEDGVAVYNVSLSNGTNVKIDPVKATILKNEKKETDMNETNDKEGRDTENDPNDRDQDEK